MGIIDLTSFGKIDVSGPGSVALLQRACANDIDKPVGSTVYGQFLEAGGGIVADVTSTRLGLDHYRVLTGAGYLAADLGWLVARAADDPPIVDVVVRDATDEWAVIGLWGPRAREVLAGVTPGPVDDGTLPIRQVRAIRIGDAKVLATRLSYAGELGWELTVAPTQAARVWDALVLAGAAYGIEPVGYRALESLRLEKGYRYFGAELTPRETPFEAGLDRFVRLGKGAFVGRDALLARISADPDDSARRLRTVTIGGADWAPIFGGEAVRIGGEVVGRLRSASFGYTVGRTVGTTYLPATVAADAKIEVDVFADRVAGEVAADVLVDPAGERMKG